jgi:predicted ferric reductase
VAERRLLVPAALAVVAVPLVIAVTDRHLSGASTALVVSTVTGAIAAGVLGLQPLLALGRRVAWHRVVGAVVLALVLVHVGALVVESPSDAWFAMSPDGPTRARMALIATIALVLGVALGLLRGRLRWHPTTWRVLHGYLAAVVIALGLGHALLTDGALDGAGTVVLVALMVVGLLGVPAAYAVRVRRGRSAPTRA